MPKSLSIFILFSFLSISTAIYAEPTSSLSISPSATVPSAKVPSATVPLPITALSKNAVPKQHSIATAHPLATLAGKQILEQGGNAFDASVAITAALAVVEPFSSGIGGGGFWMLHQASQQKTIFVDGREKAPLSANTNMYLDQKGTYIKNSSVTGALAAGVPGTIAAIAHISKKYGKLPLSQTLAPAIHYAKSGFKVTELYLRMAKFRLSAMQQFKDTAKILLKQGKLPKLGDLIVQLDLAQTLEAVAKEGAKGFYRGRVAQALVSSVQQHGGMWTLEDLKQYRIIERQPIQFTYKDLSIYSAPPPSSGGIALNTILNILSDYKIEDLSSLKQKHYIIEAMRRAYRDRAQFLGDSDFVEIPIKRLTSPLYAAGLRASIHPKKSLASSQLPGFHYPELQGNDTTHFSVIDKQGNQVSSTMSINYPFGSCLIAEGTGVLLNDEMDDFSVKPGTPNVYGLVGSKANAIEGGKRPLSSMSPSIVHQLKDGKVTGVGVIGTPGGSRIITMVLLGILDMVKNKDPQSWVDVPRFHHQYLPDSVSYEVEAIDEKSREQLKDMGHTLKQTNHYGNMHAIWWDVKTGKIKSASDKRGEGSAISF